MNKLSQFLVESILEDKSPIKKVIVIYGGRFQPFHKGHYGTYSHLVKKFGKDNVFISTSNKVERPKSPFNYKEKVKIISTMFNIPKSKIVQVKNNYAPTEILKKYDKNTTAFITVVGEKDAGRLGGKYFKPWKGKAEVGYEDGGYVYAAPSSGGGISGTETRNGLSVGSDDQKKSFFKSRAYGKFNATIFKMITDKLNEGVIEISKERIEEWLINESSKMSSGQVDDGPNFFIPNYDVFQRVSAKRAAKIGYAVVNMITSKEIEDYYDHPSYPNGPVKAVTYFPAGVLGAKTATNQVDIYSSKAYSDWYKHITRKASMVGYELVKSLASKEDLKQDKEQSVDHAKGDKKTQVEYEASLNEAINLPVEVGDTILMGRFKNKKVVVKSIGKDEHGMPTINGKKVVTFRLMKEGFEVLFEDEEFTATSKNSGKTTVFKSKDTRDAAIKAGTHTKKKDDKEEEPKDSKSAVKGKGMFKHSPDVKNEPNSNKKELAKSAIKNLKSRKSSNGESLDFETTSKGSMVIGVEHDDDKSTKETIQNIESLPKNTKVMFVGEGGMTKDDNGKIKFSGEQDEIRNATLNHFDNAEESSWDENANVYDNSSPVFDSVAKSLGGSKSKSNASIWSNMVSQGDNLDADNYLDDEGKEWLISQAKKGGAGGFDGEVDWNNLTDAQKEDLYQLNFRDDDGYGETEISKGQEAYNNFRQKELDRKIKEAEDNGYKVIAPVGNSHVDLWRQRNKSKSINEIAGTAVQCEKCNHSWEIESEDTEKYLCHSCGWDSQQQEYDYAAFDSWQEKMGLNEDVEEVSKGKLRPADLLRRKAKMAGKRAQIARRRKRTMTRRKSLSKLKKIAYKKAYLEVYKEFMEDLFPGIAKSDLSIQQAKIVHKNVLRKKKRVLKRARFKFLPKLRDAESEKFSGKGETNELMIGYAGPEDMKRFAKRNKEYRKDAESSKEYQYEPIKEQSDKKTQCINNFVEYACKRLKLQGNPKITLMSGTDYADTHKSLGGFNPQTKEIYVATENRLTADICRTIAHELVHRKQDELGLLKNIEKDGADGSPIENQAHAVAGIIMREYGRIDDTIYQEEINSFYYDDLAKYVYKKRGVINKLFKNLSDEKKAEYLEKLYIKLFQGPTSRMVHKDIKGKGGDLLKMLRKDRRLKEGTELKKLGIKDFKSLFRKMPSDLQKRVYNLKNFGQRADKHPEGNVLKHTITVVNRSIKEDDIDIAIAAMFHDIGKDETAGIHPKKGHITHFGHEKVSAGLVKKYKKWIESVGGNTANVYYIVRNHMKYKQLSVMRPKKADKVKSFRAFDKLGKFSKHDRSGLDENKATRTKFNLTIPSDIKKLQKAFKKDKKQLYVVGGAVRDALLGKKPKDFDLTTDATPEEMIKIAKQGKFKHSTNNINTNLDLGSIAINGHEVTTFRQDVGKGRRPDKVVYCDISTDSKRRDLTCNSLYYDIDKKEIIDFHGGVEDLKKGVIRTVGKPAERFDEDPLRKLRAVRFETRMNAKLDKETLDALKKDNNISQLTGDRIMREFRDAIKQSKNTKVYLERCDEIGFTKQILPGLKVSKPYPHDNNYLTFIAFILRDNDPSKVGKILNKIEYSNNDRDDIKFLISLKDFTPEKIIQFKKLHNNVKKLKDSDIVEFGKRIGKKLDKFVKFKLSVSGNDAPKDLKGPEIGLWLKNQEKEKFMKEIDDLINDIDKKIVEMFFPTNETPKPINEGGAYGHMSHPFDTDINLTFGQLKDIVNRALEGTLEFTREKTDGQALAISWRDGRLVAARNKGHLKNKGENALDIKGVSDKFQGRGGLSDAYNYAMKDLSNAIKSLNDKQRDKIFKQGACFMNLEVIYPTSVNVIPYGQALLVFHGTMEYNDEGVAIGENGEAARILAGMIKQVNKDVQDNYTIQGPPVVKLPKSQDLSKKRAKYSSQISKLQKEFGLKDTDGVANYHQAWWEQWVDKNSPSTLDNKTKMGLVKRWAFMDKKFRLDKNTIKDEKVLQWAKKTDKDDQKKISKQNLMKFEQIFLGLGAEVLEFTSSALTVNPDAAVRDMKKRIDKTIKDVKKSGDPKKIEKLKLELQRLNSIGGSKKIVPNEGIVFLYNGNTFKLTGTFASVNQILGIFF